MLKEKTLQDKKLDLQRELNEEIKKTLIEQGFEWSDDGLFNLTEKQFIEIVKLFHRFNGSTHRGYCSLDDTMGRFDIDFSKFEIEENVHLGNVLKLIKKDGQTVGRLILENKNIDFYTSVSKKDFWYDIYIHNTLITLKPIF